MQHTLRPDNLIARLNDMGVVVPGSFVLRGGESSGFYVDVKKAYGAPYMINFLAEQMWGIMDKTVSCIAASGYGGIPLATAISSRYLKPLILVRTERKEYGRGSQIEGYLPREKDRITIIDDVFTTGSNIRDMITALEPTGAEIVEACVVCRRKEGILQVPLKYLVTANDLA